MYNGRLENITATVMKTAEWNEESEETIRFLKEKEKEAGHLLEEEIATLDNTLETAR